MADVQISNENNYPIDSDRVVFVVENVLKKHDYKKEVVVSVAFVEDEKMRELNAQFHGMDDTTDVLSFPYLDPQSRKETDFYETPDASKTLGDLIISYETAKKEAIKKDISLQEEIEFLIDHGMHHLLGIHHD